ncbi:MAG: DegV family protein [Nannocystaceae bacterium]|nr:DegV family EDD domain-containing protein [bacterium]
MKILTNPGANLPPELVEHYGVSIMPQSIVVDGVEHDTRPGIPLADVDRWVEEASQFPYVLGTSAAEFAKQFILSGAEDTDILAVMSSRKIIQSHDAAVAATRTLEHHPRGKALSIRVVDTTITDLGAGLATVYAAEAAAAGHDLDSVAAMTQAFCDEARWMFALRTLSNMAKGGRASLLKVWFAHLLNVRPLLALVDGEVAAIGKYSTRDDHVAALLGAYERPSRGPVWVGIGHGGDLESARRLADMVRERFDVRYVLVRSLSSSVYLHGGPGALTLCVFDLSSLDWMPPAPPEVPYA